MADTRFAPHFEESCGCDPGCGHGSWCGADLHGVGGVDLPEWPCDDVLALTGDASREAYNQREGDEYVARIQATCHHEFEGTATCQWCGLVTVWTLEQEAAIERIADRLIALGVGAEAVEPVREWARARRPVVTASQADRQPPASSSETKGGQGPAGPDA